MFCRIFTFLRFPIMHNYFPPSESLELFEIKEKTEAVFHFIARYQPWLENTSVFIEIEWP